MDGETFARKQSALKTLLQQFDIPESRRELKSSDIRWLSRNLAVNNKNNPMFETAMGLIKWLLKNSPPTNKGNSPSINNLGKLYNYKAKQTIKLK